MDSKFLYSLLLDRSSLSAKNGWLDEEGKNQITDGLYRGTVRPGFQGHEPAD
ncbi:replication initiator protein A [Eubacterium pyruvativorans]|uniref:replication initiator protein A n=1 Tax=Eubacterium pyruvativorans TaxID=155865 RepID=UPI001FA7731F|nr:replication initiator protein A [Eubacterium pyruvativorans]